MFDFLFIAASFFGYAKEIKANLEQRGRNVIWFEDRPATDTATKALLRLSPTLIAGKAERYFDQIIEQVRQQPIRDVLVIKGEALSIEAIRRLQKALPDARFTIYFWDSYRNMPKDSFQKVALFDRALTFDPLDAASDNRLIYRPLFFVEEQVNLPTVEQDIDLLFFGTAHDDRYSIVKSIERGLPHGVRFAKVLYIPSRGIYYFRRCFDPAFRRAKRDEFIFTPLSKRNIMELVARARAVVDIERVVQTGYTMRSIETFAAGRKIISTNARLGEADFYHENNVAVMDRNKPRVDPEFLESPFMMPKRHVRQRYTLSSWLDDVLLQ
ncbi:hypothetical protein [Methylomicrobium sp. Wu6]|uniref:hypothetical protein n=1 Tax=Methylomicrobium sp. Wu6 TaxID=3107928 RepID=UPI002DD6A1FD|nr:hypothetical protein [Methylomicrobium sp. Wu6]MEC4750314.1 hypothetical protein [Methylomicrobium sp. Wu6]